MTRNETTNEVIRSEDTVMLIANTDGSYSVTDNGSEETFDTLAAAEAHYAECVAANNDRNNGK